MKEILKKYYDIEINEYNAYADGIIFFVDDKKFYFCKTIFDKNYVISNYKLSLLIKTKNIMVHDYVFNKFNEIYSEGYVLFKLNSFEDDVTFVDVIKTSAVIMNEYDNYISMLDFWHQKIDYLEQQISELSNNKLINNSFDYFVGIGEVLLLYLKNNYHIGDNIYLVHNCLDDLNTINYFNPLNFIGGDRYKDIISFIKLNDDWKLLYTILDRCSYNDKVYIFVRICFPFKYFELISDILINNKSDNELAILLTKINEYEECLRNMEKVCGIKLFSWIKKE